MNFINKLIGKVSSVFKIRPSSVTVMSDIHLGAGSVEPPRIDGLLRVYSMVFCPYAKRTRLVVKYKNLPHDIVNINLLNKPDWYFSIHPKGQVPALLDNGKIVIESLDTADYLDEKYPTDTPLYPSDPQAKKRDQEVIRNVIAEVTASFGKIAFTKSEELVLEEVVATLLAAVQPLEDELIKRGTPYFGGDTPGMIDFMLWPWAEMLPIIHSKLQVNELTLKDDQIPTLKKWVKTMMEVPVVQELYIPPEFFIETIHARRNGTLDYNALNEKLKATVKSKI